MGPLLNLGKIDAGDLIQVLYQIFHRDFVAQRTYLNRNIWVNPQSHWKEDGKEMTFWHLTTRNHKYFKREGARTVAVIERLTDYGRSQRLEWVKTIIENHADQRIRSFYFRESGPKGNLRLYLWAHQHDFVVILQKLGRSSTYLVTSFYVDHADKRRDFQRRYEDYATAQNPDLSGCEWF